MGVGNRPAQAISRGPLGGASVSEWSQPVAIAFGCDPQDAPGKTRTPDAANAPHPVHATDATTEPHPTTAAQVPKTRRVQKPAA